MAILSVVLFVIGLVVGDFNSPNIEVNVFHCNYGSNILNYYFSTMILAISLLALIAYNFKTVHCRLIEFPGETYYPGHRAEAQLETDTRRGKGI